MSDNCDHNFGTFDDIGVNNDKKVSNNMILMSKYKGKHGGKRVKKFGQGSPPPFFGQCPKENIYFFREGFPKCLTDYAQCSSIIRGRKTQKLKDSHCNVYWPIIGQICDSLFRSAPISLIPGRLRLICMSLSRLMRLI